MSTLQFEPIRTTAKPRPGCRAVWRWLFSTVVGLLMPMAQAAMPISLAVLGDSDSHGYHDTVWMKEGRGGAYAARTFQWTEILAQMRGQSLDLGPRGLWGQRKTVSQLMDWVGLNSRAPRKLDHEYNFAVSGAVCSDLMTGAFRQAPRLVALMDREPSRWRQGVVVIRIGVNTFGYQDSLQALAQDPDAPVVQAKISGCVAQMREAVQLIHARHPDTRIVLVGILNNAHWPPFMQLWHRADELTRIEQGLSRFDQALRQWADNDPRLAFKDDQAWFKQLWGGRSASGEPDYRAAAIGADWRITVTQGDAPDHVVVEDGHAGLGANLLWAQSLLVLMHTRWQMPVPLISDAEMAQYMLRTAGRPPGVVAGRGSASEPWVR